ncbi:glycoside hydrolase family 113 [Priestia megaterium]|uniref:glycoside hydrolase family 113 n=1 Tax=Priestia megaterium TaxID=1404 RepID=UPI0012B8941D|nr:hypothetical protein [Priestia megaterium]
MKKILILLSIILLIYLLLINKNLFINDSKDLPTHKENNSIHKGVALTLLDPYNTDKFYDEILPKIKDLNAELEIVTKVNVNNPRDSNPINDPYIKDKLNRLFAKSEEYGVKVSVIKPHLMTPENGDSFDRGTYNPQDTKAFFSKWKNIILYYAKVSEEHNVSFLSITCETSIITQNTYIPYWQEIINEVKKKYPKVKLTMAFKKSDLDREIAYHENGVISIIPFLDNISLNMFPKVKREYVKKKNIVPSDDIFLNSPETYGFVTTIRKANQYYDKDVLITEAGSSSRTDLTKNYLNPFFFDNTAPKDHNDQNQWVRIVLSVLLQMKEVKGIYVWHVDHPFEFLGTSTAETVRKLYSK